MKLKSLFQQEDRTLIENYCEGRAKWGALPDGSALCRVLGSIDMYVELRDISLTPHLLQRGYWEMWVTQAIASYVKPGMRCIDVGANCGYFALLMSELVGDKGFVEAFEPQPRLVELLKRSIAVNGFGRQTSVVEAAVSDMNGSAVLSEAPNLMGSASLRGLSEPGATTRTVEMVTLDRIGFGEPLAPAIDLVKIDVEGLEMKVLAGMKQMIAASPKIAIVMEFTPIDHEDPARELLRVQEMGLTLGEIGTDGLVRPISILDAAATAGGFRMLWLTRAS